jgi:hypothetical protein
MVWWLLIVKGLGMCMYPLDATLTNLDTIHGPKPTNGGATQRQIPYIQLFRRLPLITDEFGHGTNSIGKVISLPLHAVQGHPNWMSYTTWESVLMWRSPG